jgi:hypothetical protein
MTVVERRHVARLGAPAVEPSAPDHRSARIAADPDVSMIFCGVSEPRYGATDQDPVRL